MSIPVYTLVASIRCVATINRTNKLPYRVRDSVLRNGSVNDTLVRQIEMTLAIILP